MPEFLKRHWTQINAQFGQMPGNTRLLIGSMVIILVLVGYLVVQYAAEPEMVPITSFASENPAQVASYLQSRGIEVKQEGGQVLVANDEQVTAISYLQSSGLMVADTSKAFDEMIAGSSAWDPLSKTKMAFVEAKRKFLSAVVEKMKGVQAADVVLAMPESTGFGRTYVKPTASVSVVMQGGTRMNKQLVEAIAGLVSGSVAEMTPQEVTVVNATTGTVHRVADPDMVTSEDALMLIGQLEKFHREKIGDMLRYVPGIIVAVNVRPDPVRMENLRKFEYAEQAIKTEDSKSTKTSDVRRSGEPGPRSNVGEDIVAGAKNGTSSETEETRSEFYEPTLSSEALITKIGHLPQEINVTVNVPRSYVVSLLKQEKGEDAELTEADILAFAKSENGPLEEIRKQVEPQVKAGDNKGSVTTHMVMDASTLMAKTASANSGGVLNLVGGGWMQPAVLGGLALFSIGLMFHMVKKATKPEALPTAQELAGVPPTMDVEDMVSEADEFEGALAGIELGEEEISARKIVEQIEELVNGSPESSAAMFQRWMRQGNE